jgi:hypothetical protein
MERVRAQALLGAAGNVLIKPFSEQALMNAIHVALTPNEFKTRRCRKIGKGATDSDAKLLNAIAAALRNC